MTELLWGVFVGPFKDMAGSPSFLAEVLIGGVAAGLMYSLVALGFVLIFKASGVFNFAQGVMVLFAALTLVGLLERKVPVVLALAVTALVMIALAFAIERVVLRPLVNQEHIILFMATIGLNFFLEGFGEMLWGANVKKLDIGIPDESFKVSGILVNRPRAARGGRRPRGGPVHRHPPQDHLGRGVVGGRNSRHRGWGHVGRQERRAVQSVARGAQGPARADSRRLRVRPRCHRGRRPHRRRREGRRGLLGPPRRRRHRKLVRLRPGIGVPADPPAGPVRRENHRARVTTP
jgi:hypothetical protein